MTFGKRGFPLPWLLALLLVCGSAGGDGLSSVIAADQPPGISLGEEDGLDTDFTSDDAWLAGDDEFLNDHVDVDGARGIADPLEPINRVFFQFNDTLYYWVVKPVSTIYGHVVAEGIRISFRNFFKNLSAPVRVVNNLLQGKVKNTGIELARFTINSTAGILGFGDPAKDMGLMAAEEDLGQTLGVYGIGNGIYIHWPILGPSSLRDTVGIVGDAFLEPMTYLASGRPRVGVGVYAGRRVNDSSLTLGDYELFKKTSLDPYTAIRNAYFQFRQGRVLDLNPGDGDALGDGSPERGIGPTVQEKEPETYPEPVAPVEQPEPSVAETTPASPEAVSSPLPAATAARPPSEEEEQEAATVGGSATAPAPAQPREKAVFSVATVAAVPEREHGAAVQQVPADLAPPAVTGNPLSSSVRINPQIFAEF